jgi:hypothetical protein
MLSKALQAVNAILREEVEGETNDDDKKALVARFVVYGGFEACMSVWRQQYSVVMQEKTLFLPLLVYVVQTSPSSLQGN